MFNDDEKILVEISIEKEGENFSLMKKKFIINDSQDDIKYNILDHVKGNKVKQNSSQLVILNNLYDNIKLKDRLNYYSNDEDFLYLKFQCINSFSNSHVFPTYYQKKILSVYIDKILSVKNIHQLSNTLLNLFLNTTDLVNDIVLSYKLNTSLKDFNKDFKLEKMKYILLPILLNFNSRFKNSESLESMKFYKFINTNNINLQFDIGQIIYSDQFISFGEEAELIDQFSSVIINNKSYNTIIQFNMSKKRDRDFRSIISVKDISKNEKILYLMSPFTKFRVTKIISKDSISPVRIKYETIEVEELEDNFIHDSLFYNLYSERDFCNKSESKTHFEKVSLYYENSSKIISEFIETNCFDNAVINDNLGLIYFCYDEFSVSFEYFIKALEMKIFKIEEQNRNVDDNISVADSYVYIASNYIKLEKYLEALDYYNKSLKIYIRLLGLSNLVIANIYIKIAETFILLLENNEAIKFLNNALIIQKKLLGEIDLETCDTLLKLGKVLEDVHEYEDSKNLYQFALEYRIQIVGEYSTLVVLNYTYLGSVHQKMENFEDSMKYYNKALNLQIHLTGENNSIIAKIYSQIGISFVKKFTSNIEKSLEFFKKSLKIWDLIYNNGAVDFDVADCYMNIAEAFLKANNYELAKANLDKAYKIKKTLYDDNDNHREILNLVLQIGDCEMKSFSKEKYKLILEIYEKALKIEIKLSGNHDSYQTAIILEKIGEIYYKMCLYDLSLEVKEYW